MPEVSQSAPESASLDDLALAFGTDKCSAFHGYAPIYEELLRPLLAQPVRLLEIGVLGGSSIAMWAAWFRHADARFIGIDIDTTRCMPLPDPRITILRASATDPGLWPGIGAQDIVIDDGSHLATEQTAGFQLGWKHVSPGGVWIIEDLHTAWSAEHCPAGVNVMQFLFGLTTGMQARGALARARDVTTDIHSVAFHHGLAVIRKAR
ncbi:MAG: class I SAM-dependent methyltransferase [Chthoniobacteraceae bacterium]